MLACYQATARSARSYAHAHSKLVLAHLAQGRSTSSAPLGQLRSSRSSAMPIPSLPLEIIDHIIALAQDYSLESCTLAAACAIVSKGWLPVARRNLYYTLDAGDAGFLDDVGINSPRMRHVLGVPSFADFVMEADFEPSSTTRPQATTDNGRFVMASNLLVVGVTCVNLKRLTLSRLPPATLSWLVKSCPRPPITFPRLLALDIDDTRYESTEPGEAIKQLPEGFNDFLAAIPTLRSLRIAAFGVDAELVLPPTCCRFDIEPGIRVNNPITFDTCVPYILRAIGCQSAADFSFLRHLVLDFPDRKPFQAQTITAITSRCPSLTCLEVSGPRVDYSPSRPAELPALDVVPSLPSTLVKLSFMYEMTEFIAHGILAYLKDLRRSAALRVLDIEVEELKDKEAVRDVCFERRIWVEGKVARK